MNSNEKSKELISAWVNDKKRASYLGAYKDWGVWIEVPELKLAYFKYTLPDKTDIIAMDHMHRGYDSKNQKYKWEKTVTYYERKKGDPFSPDSRISEGAAKDLLKNAKMKLIQDLKEKNQ